MKSLKRSVILGAISMAMAMPAVAEKWDMPMAYSGSNFHSVTGAEFAKCVTTGTGGDIEIVTHPFRVFVPWCADKASHSVWAGANWRETAVRSSERKRPVRVRLCSVSGHII